MAKTLHCHRCGWQFALPGQPGRNESCHQCGADLKVCLNCVHYTLSAAYQCNERRADPVLEKETANFCEYFEMARRDWKSNPNAASQEDQARDRLRKLLGDE